VITVLSDQLITVVAGPQIGATMLGVFVVGSDLASIPLSRGMPIINQIMLPAFSKFQDDRESATYYYGRLLTVASVVFVPMLVGLACVADSLILAVVGAKWEESIVPLALMSLGMIFRMHNHLIKTVMISMGRPALMLTSNLLQLTSLFIFTTLALERGVVGLVLAWVLTEFLIALISIPLSQRILDTGSKFLLHAYRAALVSSILMGACVMGTKAIMNGYPEIVTLLLSVFVGIISFYFAMRLIFIKEMSIAATVLFGSRFAFLVAAPPKHRRSDSKSVGD
jgi:O-antigen/teichoic acid export membrane protein